MDFIEKNAFKKLPTSEKFPSFKLSSSLVKKITILFMKELRDLKKDIHAHCGYFVIKFVFGVHMLMDRHRSAHSMIHEVDEGILRFTCVLDDYFVCLLRWEQSVQIPNAPCNKHVLHLNTLLNK